MKNLWFAMINISKSFGGAFGSAETKSSSFIKTKSFKIVIPPLQNHHPFHLRQHEYCLRHQ